MPRIIYAWNGLKWGGAQTFFLSLIRTVRDEFDILMLVPEGTSSQMIQFIEEESIEYGFFGPSYDGEACKGLAQKLSGRWKKMKSEAALLRKLEEAGLEDSIVHVELSPWYSLHSLIWLSLRCPVFITMHNALPGVGVLRRLQWKLKLRLISRFRNFNVFASNKHCKAYFHDLYSAEFFDRIRVVYTNAAARELEEIEEARPERDGMREKFGLPKDRFLFFCVGQFIDRKGRWTFLEAARQIRKETDEAAFVWIANSPPAEKDLEKVASYGLRDDFHLITSDRVGDRHLDLMRLLSAADAFVLASFVEGLPIALLEAMGIGIPSISTNVFAIPEAIEHETTGLLVEPGDAEGLQAAMLRLMRDSGLRTRIAAGGRQVVIERFTDREAGRIALESYREAYNR